jgi:hypothetical protein
MCAKHCSTYTPKRYAVVVRRFYHDLDDLSVARMDLGVILGV